MDWPRDWSEPARLDLVRQTAINCLLCPVEPSREFRQAAQAASIECLPPNSPAVTWRPLKEIDWKTAAPIIGVSDGVWPKLDIKRGGTSESTGPTGAPWLDANGWVIQLARSRGQGKPVWLRADPPQQNEVIGIPDYLLAIHEAEAFGARRPVWLSPVHAQELVKGIPAARQGWQSITGALAWWRSHQEWSQWPVDARLLVVSDFSGPNEYLATEILNLSARRDLAFHAATPDQVTDKSLHGLRALIYADQQPPAAALLTLMQQFADSGGLVLAAKETTAKLKGLKPLAETHPRFTLYSAGKGRVAVPKPAWDDPYLVAVDTHLLMSRRHDSVRLFNGGSLNIHHVVSPDGSRSVVHLLNYARRGGAQQVLLQSQRPVRSARLLEPSKSEPVTLTVNREMGRYEMPLPPLAVYGAVELEHSS